MIHRKKNDLFHEDATCLCWWASDVVFKKKKKKKKDREYRKRYTVHDLFHYDRQKSASSAPPFHFYCYYWAKLHYCDLHVKTFIFYFYEVA